MPTQAFDSAKELALTLSEAERAELAHELVASLDGPPDPDATDLWEAEVLRRLDQIDQGNAEFLSPDELRERIRTRLARS
jgi:putative addiction module component (TIGR02574 family)